jgi:hypothetical protein
MRKILLALAALLATVTTPTAAQANIGDSSRFSVSFSIPTYPGGGNSGACGSFRMVTFGPDFDSCNGGGGVNASPCGVGQADVVIVPTASDSGYYKIPVHLTISWVGAYAAVVGEDALANRYAAPAAAIVIHSPLLAVGAMVDACDGFGPPVSANVTITGVLVGIP